MLLDDTHSLNGDPAIPVGTRKRRLSRTRLTVVTPVFNEEANLQAFAAAVTATLFAAADLDAEVLFVDDGSTDGSWALINALCDEDGRFSGIRLSRNFGAHLALAAGFDQVPVEADAVATLACDLQDPPETVLEFVRAWREGADIVWGSRLERGDATARAVASKLLEHLLRRYAMPQGSRFRTGSFLLVDRLVLDCLLRYREHNRVTFALVAWTGFDQANVNYVRRARTAGRSGWSFGRMLNTAYDVFIGFSPVPAKLVTTLGFCLFALSLSLLTYLLTAWLFNSVQPGWTGIMTALIFFFGILFIMIGLLAEYLYRIFVETKNRPLYFIARRTANIDASVVLAR